MKRLGTAKIRMNFAKGVTYAFHPPLEVSLDCFICRRRHRTIIMKGLGGAGVCTPTGHQFPGTLVEIMTGRGEGLFAFTYEFESFADQKYPDEVRYAKWEKGAPSWVRVHFEITCPECGFVKADSTQTNLVRPHNTSCRCGRQLYTDDQIPELLWRSAENTEPGAAPNAGSTSAPPA